MKTIETVQHRPKKRPAKKQTGKARKEKTPQSRHDAELERKRREEKSSMYSPDDDFVLDDEDINFGKLHESNGNRIIHHYDDDDEDDDF